jgi:hypothetical protein
MRLGHSVTIYGGFSEMKTIKHNDANNVVFNHFRCCGPIVVDGGKYIYAIPLTFFAKYILRNRGYSELYSMMLGRIYRKPISQPVGGQVDVKC